MWMTIVNVILALPKIIGAVKALVTMWQEMERIKKDKKAEDLKKEIADAKSEDDFRSVADKL